MLMGLAWPQHYGTVDGQVESHVICGRMGLHPMRELLASWLMQLSWTEIALSQPLEWLQREGTISFSELDDCEAFNIELDFFGFLLLAAG